MDCIGLAHEGRRCEEMLPDKVKDEIRDMAVSWNLPLDHAYLMDEYPHPELVRGYLMETIQDIIERMCESEDLQEDRFVIWIFERAWMSRGNEFRHAVVVKYTSSLDDPRSLTVLHRAFKEMTEHSDYFHIEGGGHPIRDGAYPVFWYGDGEMVELAKEAHDFCREEFDRMQDPMSIVFGGLKPNPYK